MPLPCRLDSRPGRSGHSAKLPAGTVVDLHFEDRLGSVGTWERRAVRQCGPAPLEEFTGRLALNSSMGSLHPLSPSSRLT